MHSIRSTEKVVGVLLLTVFVAYGAGNGFIESVTSTSDYLSNIAANKMKIRIGASLMLLNSVLAAGIGILIYPILKEHHKPIAVGYLCTRVIESGILIVGIISLLTLIPLSQQYINATEAQASYYLSLGALAQKSNFFAYQIAMAVLGIGSLFFCYLLYQSKLIPVFLSVWGLIGYAIFLTGALLEIYGFKVGLILSVPGGLFEICLGIWLMTKGFNRSAMTSNN